MTKDSVYSHWSSDIVSVVPSLQIRASDVIKSVFRKGSDETFISSLEALGKDQ